MITQPFTRLLHENEGSNAPIFKAKSMQFLVQAKRINIAIMSLEFPRALVSGARISGAQSACVRGAQNSKISQYN